MHMSPTLKLGLSFKRRNTPIYGICGDHVRTYWAIDDRFCYVSFNQNCIVEQYRYMYEYKKSHLLWLIKYMFLP